MEPSWNIALVREEGVNETLLIPKGGAVLGREEHCDLVLSSVEFPGVSGHHARLDVEDKKLFLEDAGSRNGTLVLGEPIERIELRHGASFQLGAGGPLFVVSSSAHLDETVTIPRDRLKLDGTKPKRGVGAKTLFLLRDKLGLPNQRDVGQLVRRQGRRNLLVNLGLILVLVSLAVWLYVRQRQNDDQALAALRQQTESLSAKLDEAQGVVENQRRTSEEQERRFEEVRLSWEEERRSLLVDRERLAASIAQLEREGKMDAEELHLLKGQLEDTSERLDLFDPVNLENERLQRVAGFEDVVVLIEASRFWREEDSPRRLYVKEEGSGYLKPNLEGDGELLERSATGSGFCVSPEGWILSLIHI